MNVIQLQEPKALLIPDVQNLLKRAFDSDVLIAQVTLNDVAEEVFHYVTDDDKFMFLGAEDGIFKSVVMGFLPHGRMFPYPMISVFYNEGTRALSRATREVLMDFILSRGYTSVLAANGSGYKDDVWLKGLTPEGAVGQLVGTLALFKVK